MSRWKVVFIISHFSVRKRREEREGFCEGQMRKNVLPQISASDFYRVHSALKSGSLFSLLDQNRRQWTRDLRLFWHKNWTWICRRWLDIFPQKGSKKIMQKRHFLLHKIFLKIALGMIAPACECSTNHDCLKIISMKISYVWNRSFLWVGKTPDY